MQIGKRGRAVTHICQASADRIEVRGRDLPRSHGPRVLHRIFLPAPHRPRADRRPALFPRSPARRHRRARPDADRAGRAHDARRRSGFAAGRACRRHSRRRPGDSGHIRALRQAAGRSATGRCGRRRCRRGSAELVQAHPRSGGKAPGFGHPVHSPSIRAPSASSNWPTSAASAARMSPWRPHRPRGRHRLGQAAGHECLHADRRRAARPRLPAIDGQGHPDAGAHGEPSRPSRRGAGESDRLSHGRARRGGGRL